MVPESITLICHIRKIDFGFIIKISVVSYCIVIYNCSINANVLPEPIGMREKISSLLKRKEISYKGLYPILLPTRWLGRKP
jgi:hypothetical protein